jgi:hypothetical protein
MRAHKRIGELNAVMRPPRRSANTGDLRTFDQPSGEQRLTARAIDRLSTPVGS